MPYPVIFFILIAAAFAVILNRTVFGFNVYMLGTNPTAALFSGINIDRVLIRTYWLAGMVAGVAGIIFLARANSAKPDYGASFILLTVLIAIALHLFLSRSKTGRAMRAVSDEPELAAVAGLDTEKVVRWTWVIGAALAAAAGVFAGMDTSMHPNLGWNLLLPMFAAAILGGIGKPMGAIAGGLIIGVAEECVTYTWLGSEPLISPSYKSAVAFTIMVGLLLFRPQGLFKGRLL